MSERSDHVSSQLEELKSQLRSLDEGDLAGLGRGLDALGSGSVGVRVAPEAELIDVSDVDPATQEVIELFNRLLVRSRTVLRKYELLRQSVLLCQLESDLTRFPAPKVSHHV
jgi:hypothetical protein